MIYRVDATISKDEISLARFDINSIIKNKFSEVISKKIVSKIPVRLIESNRVDLEVYSSKFYLEDGEAMKEKMKKIKELLCEEDFLKVRRILDVWRN